VEGRILVEATDVLTVRLTVRRGGHGGGGGGGRGGVSYIEDPRALLRQPRIFAWKILV
jgi:hypothetical protein